MADEDEAETPNPEAQAKDDERPEAPESPKQEFVPPTDGSWIPRDRFNEAVMGERSKAERLEAMLAAEREERIRLEERVKAKTETASQYTRSQLQGLVDEGKLNQDQADALWESQLEARLAAKIHAEADAKAARARKLDKVNDALRQYRTARPDIATPGSEDRLRVESEYRYLVDVLGQPEGIETEAAACRAAFGPPEKAQAVTRERRETPSESGAPRQEAPGSRLPKISNRLKEFYAQQISKGQYSGWDDPNLMKEIQIAGSRR